MDVDWQWPLYCKYWKQAEGQEGKGWKPSTKETSSSQFPKGKIGIKHKSHTILSLNQNVRTMRLDTNLEQSSKRSRMPPPQVPEMDRGKEGEAGDQDLEANSCWRYRRSSKACCSLRNLRYCHAILKSPCQNTKLSRPTKSKPSPNLTLNPKP